MKLIDFKLMTPEGVKYESEINQITLTTEMGEITILPGHLSLISSLVPGEALIKRGSAVIPLVVHGGFVQISPDHSVVLMTDAAEQIDELDEQQVEHAIKRAEQLKKEKFRTAEYEDAAFALIREQARIRVLKKYRAKGYGADRKAKRP